MLQQKRLKSSTQQARVVKDEFTPAILHGNQRLHQQGLQPEKSSSKPSYPRQAPSTSSKQRNSAEKHRHAQQEHPRSSQENPNVRRGRRRRAKRSSTVGPAQGRIVEHQKEPEIELKNEDYLRNHIYVPNTQDYPGLPPAIFESPRSALRNRCAKSFQTKCSRIMGRYGFRFTVTFKINDHNEVCIGESKERVTYFDLPSLNRV